MLSKSPRGANDRNERVPNRDIVVVGASAGGVEALSTFVSLLPADLPAAVFVVNHVQPIQPGYLPSILAQNSALPVKHADDGEIIQHGMIYVARPDHHLLVKREHVSVARGPKENLHRPSVDSLFRSAAYAYGPRVIAVVLTGNLDDGSAGNWAVKAFGGVTIAQDPEDAPNPDMPRNAIQYSKVDHVAPLAKIPMLISHLVREEVQERGERSVKREEIRIPESELRGNPDAREFGTPSYFTCPSCTGTLWEFKYGDLVRYRCRTGHAFSFESMMAEHAEAVETALWVAVRTLEEKADLMRHMAEHAQERTTPERQQHYQKQQVKAKENADIIRELLKTAETPATDEQTKA